jgi:hypothetical protein
MEEAGHDLSVMGRKSCNAMERTLRLKHVSTTAEKLGDK